MIFLMISTKKSQRYTAVSLSSLLRRTFIRGRDRLVVVDNDGDLRAEDLEMSELLRNPEPRSFAENANLGLRLAREAQTDLMLLNNDIIFTRYWLDYLDPKPGVISVPYCNQDALYSHGGLKLGFAMSLEEFSPELEGDLEVIAESHRRLSTAKKFVGVVHPLVPYFCVHIPLDVAQKVGDFDESLGRGGGEDVDYRLRAALAGINTRKVSDAYLLHFMGKSTWLSGESNEESVRHEQFYRKKFTEKWGEALASLFLSGGDKAALARQLGVIDDLLKDDIATVAAKLKRPAAAAPS